jgi:hypothetical protein
MEITKNGEKAFEPVGSCTGMETVVQNATMKLLGDVVHVECVLELVGDTHPSISGDKTRKKFRMLKVCRVQELPRPWSPGI